MIKTWEFLLTIGVLIEVVSLYYLVINQTHTALEYFGIGLIPIALILIGPSSIIHHMNRPKSQLEVEEIDLEWDL